MDLSLGGIDKRANTCRVRLLPPLDDSHHFILARLASCRVLGLHGPYDLMLLLLVLRLVRLDCGRFWRPLAARFCCGNARGMLQAATCGRVHEAASGYDFCDIRFDEMADGGWFECLVSSGSSGLEK